MDNSQETITSYQSPGGDPFIQLPPDTDPPQGEDPPTTEDPPATPPATTSAASDWLKWLPWLAGSVLLIYWLRKK